MKHRNLTISTLAALILMSACTEGEGTGVEPDHLAGTWTSTSFVLTSVANPSMSMDLVAEEGAALTLVLGADGTYSFTFVSNVEPTENEVGNLHGVRQHHDGHPNGRARRDDCDSQGRRHPDDDDGR